VKAKVISTHFAWQSFFEIKQGAREKKGKQSQRQSIHFRSVYILSAINGMYWSVFVMNPPELDDDLSNMFLVPGKKKEDSRHHHQDQGYPDPNRFKAKGRKA
jgi:hypothetical protein